MALLFMSANYSNEVMAAKNTLDQKILKSKPTTIVETLPPYVEDMERSSNQDNMWQISLHMFISTVL